MRPLLFIALLLATVPAVAQLQVHYGAKSLMISGASPSAQVVVFGVIHSNYRGQELIQEPQSIEQADAAGVVTVTVDRPSFRSVWLIIDLGTGEFLVSSPPGYQFRQTAIPTDAIEQTGRGLMHTRPSVDVFVARRGVGAWHARSSEAGSTVPRDARVSVNADHLQPVGATPPAPLLLVPGDVVMAFDVPFMEFWVTKLKATDLPGAR